MPDDKTGIDPRKFRLLETKATDLEARITGLGDALAKRDEFIKALNGEKLVLSNRVAELELQVSRKGEELKALAAGKEALAKLSDQKTGKYIEALAQKDAEVKSLQDKVKTGAAGTVSDKTLVAEMENLSLRHETIKKDLLMKDQYLLEVRNELNILRSAHDDLAKEKENLQKLILAEQQEKNGYRSELATLNQKTRAAFTARQLAGYLTDAIDSFNAQASTSEKSVNYVINGMDVELKASVAKSEGNELIMAAPGLGASTESALSNIKFSIIAVPNRADLDK